jgi:predicted O-linked N-acetylglucosamine transferase (SPINDLY family)
VSAYDAAVKRGAVPSHAGRKIKLAFISMFFREHASGKMIQGIIKNIDKSKFHVTVFCLKGCEGILTNQSHSF